MTEKDWRLPTQGTWFAAYGSVYSLLDDGSVVRVTHMDREERGTLPTERDANAHLIVKLQNIWVGKMLSPEELDEAREAIG